ncbi:MOSC domain-containing protein [Zhihengliuella salsuginis]|uniref:MOSC domain-containing protein n=1 Tax=Zhihengliuella salsuginis TaxID=578222 RepID=A0ABQ3GLC1_9MICC|nr:MOSC domain-containing protein [Zhihengliuella salsuginis]GHD10104.1 MOSC domain-containing protein [Zhihengliuella salsuginis]
MTESTTGAGRDTTTAAAARAVGEPVAVGRLEAVCRVHQLAPDAGAVGVTAIDKRPVETAVKVARLGLYADVQADREHHGGEEQAVYAYAQEEADAWGERLGRDIPAGLFGENLRISGLAVSDAVIGERWSIGEAELEVTIPRTPCATFARRMGEERWVRRFTEQADTGCYLRVVRKGRIAAGDAVAVVMRPSHGITVRDLFVGPTPEQAAALRDGRRAGEWELSPKAAREVEQVLAR